MARKLNLTSKRNSKSRRRPANLHIAQLEDRVVPAGNITGTVFLDFNADGTFDNAPRSILNASGNGSTNLSQDVAWPGAAVTVTAYGPDNTVRGTMTTTNGSYNLPVTGSGPYRLEFTGLPSGIFFGPTGNATGTSVQFVNDPNGGTINANLGVVATELITQDNPNLITNEYKFGAFDGPNALLPTVLAFPYNAGNTTTDNPPPGSGQYNTSLANYQTPGGHPILAIPMNQVGTTWGLAYNRNTNQVYMAAFQKRHAGTGPNGLGAIYQSAPITAGGGTVSTASLLIDLNAAVPGNPAGVSYRNTAGWDYLNDGLANNVGWDAVGKMGLGGLEATPDGRYLVTVALADRRVYIIDTTTLQVRGYDIPVPTGLNGVTGITAANPLGDLRPFAVSYYNGEFYIGAVNSGESTISAINPNGLSSSLRAYVFRLTLGASPITGSATFAAAPVVNMPLDYQRGYAHPSAGAPDGTVPAVPVSGNWNVWSPTYKNLADPARRETIYPQPWLTGITFDQNGNMMLGIRDRNGDQTGALTPVDATKPDLPVNYKVGINVGDTLRVSINTPMVVANGWTPESNGTAGGVTSGTGAGNGQGPGGGEFYSGDYLTGQFIGAINPPNPDHNETSLGGVLQIAGYPDLATTSFDPAQLVGRYNAGGIRWYSNVGADAGASNRGYELYFSDINLAPPPSPPTFAKANGIGDLIAASTTPNEIGNRIWFDTNKNGLQDAGEPGIANVTVQLVDPVTGGVLATTVTDSNGNYYFTSAIAPAAGAVPGKAYGVNMRAGTAYRVQIPLGQAALAAFSLTTANANGNSRDTIDSDADATGAITVAALLLGEANHTYDAGFISRLSIGDYVWEDRNNDGQWQVGEPALPGVLVQLVDVNNTILGTFTTNADGGYIFTDLNPGQYRVRIPVGAAATQPALVGFNSSSGTPGSLAGPFEPAVPVDNANNFDHGTTQGGFVVGPLIDLAFGTAPTNDLAPPPAGIDAIDPAANNSSYRNQDFGFFRPLSLGDLVWEDANNNGTRDNGEPAIAGVAVRLLDGNGTPVLGTGGLPITAITAADGGYLFTNLGAGKYIVEVVTPAGYVSSTGTPGSLTGPYEPLSVAAGNNQDHGTISGTVVRGPVVNLQPGTAPTNDLVGPTVVDPARNEDSDRTQDFGFFRPLSLGDLVWEDANNNGTRDNGEPAIAGVAVRLLDGNGTPVLGPGGLPITAITAADGGYLFTNLAAGKYIVEVVTPAGYVSSTGTPGSLTGPYEPLSVAAGNNQDHGTISGTVVRGPVVNLQPGTAPTNDLVGPTVVDPARNEDSDRTQDFGFFRPLSLGDLVWEDANNNGTRDNGEPAIAGVAVRLLDGNGTPVLGPGGLPITAITAADGGYLFTNLGAGKYIVEVVTPAGFVSSTGTPGSLTGPYEPLSVAAGNNQDHGTINGTVVRGPVVNLQPGTAPTNDLVGPTVVDPARNQDSDRTQDFGFFRPLSLGDLVWEDANNNGVVDVGETPMGGVTVRLLDGNSNPVIGINGTPLTLQTAPDGGYLFTNLGAGNYRVEVVIPSGYKSSTGTVGSPTGPYEPLSVTAGNNQDHGTTNGAVVRGPVVNLQPGTAPTNDLTGPTVNDPARNQDSDRTQDFGLFRPLALGDLVWRDNNNNGVVDAGEPGIGGVTVRLLDSNGTVIGTKTTDSNGLYRFNDLVPGTYSVEIDPPAGLVTSTGNGFPIGTSGLYEPAQQTIVNNSDHGNAQANGTIRALPVTLTAYGTTGNPDENGVGNANLRQDFGLVLPPPSLASISGYVYIDYTNINGIRQYDSGERGIGGTRIVLDGPSGQLTTYTDFNGFYQFLNLPAGTYTVREEQPFGTWYNGITTVGTVGGTPRGTAGNDIIRSVTLNANDAGIEYNFGELPFTGTFGYVWVDDNRNGIRDIGELPISGTTVTLSGTAFTGTILERPLDAADVPGGLTRVTDGNGRYDFPIMPVGTYSLTETQPVDYDDFKEQDGDPYGTRGNIANDIFSGVSFVPPFQGPYNFGEVLSSSDPRFPRSPAIPVDPSKREFLGSETQEAIAFQNARNRSRAFESQSVQTDFQDVPGGVAPVVGIPVTPTFGITPPSPLDVTSVVISTGQGISPIVRVFDYATKTERQRFSAFETGFTGAVRVGSGDFNKDGIPDTIVAVGSNGGPRIRIFDGATSDPLQDFFAYESTFTGGMSIAVGDVNGDGMPDIVTGTESGGGPRIRVFSGADMSVLQDFFAFDSTQRGGVRVAVADFNGDGKADIVATTALGVATRVRVFSGDDQSILQDFAPYAADFTGGAFVAAGDFNGDGTPDIVTGADVGGGPDVRIFDGATGAQIAGLMAFEMSFTGGVRVSAVDINRDGKAELIVGAGPGGATRVSVFTGPNLDRVDDFFGFGVDFTGGVYVAAAAGKRVPTNNPNAPAAVGSLGVPGTLPTL